MVACLTLRRYDISENAAKCTITVLMEMKDHIRNVHHGDSKLYYGGKKWKKEGNILPHGNGKGNGSGPALWAAISSPLLLILPELGYGIKFQSATTGAIMNISVFGFVDDMDYVQTALPGENEDDVFKKAQMGMK